MSGADIDDGIASVRGMVAIAQSVRTGKAGQARRRVGSGLMKLGIFAKTFPGTAPSRCCRRRPLPAMPPCSTTWPAPALARFPSDRARGRRRRPGRLPRDRGRDRRRLGDLQHDPSGPCIERGRTAELRSDRLRGRPNGHASCSRSAPAAATRRTSGATIPTTHGGAAWREMINEFQLLVEIADRYDILIGVEPELANVVNSARRARS